MTNHRRDGPARIRHVHLGLRQRLELSFWLLLLLACIASALDWLPDWVRTAVIVVVAVNYVRDQIPDIAAALRRLRATIPRLDPDYRRRRDVGASDTDGMCSAGR